MLLNGGELGGVRLLSPHAVDLMWQNHLTPSQLPYELNDWTSDPETGYGFGLAVTTTSERSISDVEWAEHTGDNRVCEVGWGGGANTNWHVSE